MLGDERPLRHPVRVVSSNGVHIALLRAINVGGNDKLPMQDLRAMFEDAGCADGRTYIQSGNVVFEASAALARRIPDVVGGAIESRFGFRPPLVMRTAGELREVLRPHPFAEQASEHELLHVAFLADAPKRGARLDAARAPGDRFEVRGREVYLFYPSGSARSKLDNPYLERCLGTTSTMRNWRTVTRLGELIES